MKLKLPLRTIMLLGMLLAAGCARDKIATNDPDFLAVKEGKFTFLIECYVFEERNDRSPVPWVGFPTVARGVGSRRFPENPREWIGKEYDTIKILDVIPKGTAFTVVRHRIENAPTMGKLHHWDIAVEGPLAQRWPLLDGYALMNKRNERIQFHSQVVAKL
jgi:hypothetical protein